MDITKMNLVELKSLAYDQLAQLEQTQNNLKIINQEIINRQQSESLQATIDKGLENGSVKVEQENKSKKK